VVVIRIMYEWNILFQNEKLFDLNWIHRPLEQDLYSVHNKSCGIDSLSHTFELIDISWLD